MGTLAKGLRALGLIALLGGGTWACAENAGVNQQESEAFLAQNAEKEGVTVTASGLQYQVLKKGDGKTPGPTDSVTVNYRGTLISGQEFDSSKAITFSLERVIPGWTEGLQLMQEGAQYRFFIPSELAYGSRGAGRAIGPNQALVFEVELIRVNR